MTEYESILRQAILNVIRFYPDQLSRNEINRYTKREFRKLSDEYPMKHIQQDALTAYAVISRGGEWVSYNVREKLSRRMIKFNYVHHPIKQESLIEFLRNETDRTGRHGRFKKGARV